MVKNKHLFLLLTLLLFCAGAFGQGKRVTVVFKNVEATTALRQIEKQSGMKMQYSIKDMNFRVTYSARNAEPVKVVKDIVGIHGFTVSTEGKYIMIHRNTKTIFVLSGHTRNISGYVRDESEEPLVGVPIYIDETKVRAVTDANGFYTFRIPVEQTVLKFSYVGHEAEYVTIVKGEKDVNRNVVLKSVLQLSEVVVTGYQTMSKRESASAISTIKAEDIMVDGVSSIDQMLQGRIPGMAVMNTSGEPSATPKIRIRGNATINGSKSPVWVVDGVIVEQDVPFSASDINSEDAQYLIGNAISGLNPQDIETITVLKDASATAIYGVRAANGVIIITTKRGKVGKPQITYNGGITLNTRPSYNDFDLMNSQQRVAFSKTLVDAGFPSNRVPVGETYEGYYEKLLGKSISQEEFSDAVILMQTRNTDWFGYLFRNNITHSHTASISGGSERLRYYMSAGYSDVQGSSVNSESERLNVMTRVDGQINKIVSFEARLSYSNTTNVGYHSSINPFTYAYQTSRTIPLYNDDGSYHKIYQAGGYSGTEEISYNVMEELNNTGQKSLMENIDAMLNINIKILPFLTYQGTFSYASANTSTRNWATDQSYYIGANYRMYDYGRYTQYDPEYMNSQLPYGGILETSRIRNHGYTIRNQIQLRQIFANVHSVDLIGGTEARRNAYDGVSQTGYGWTPEYGEKFNAVMTDSYVYRYLQNRSNDPKITNSFTQVASFYGIASYSFDNRYVFNFNIRSDGSNKFGSNPKYRWLPTFSFALRWNMKNESFLKNKKWVDELSLRGSYGIQGNISDNDSPKMVLQVGDRDYVVGLPTASIYRYANPDLRWEKTHSWNAAIDFSFLKGRIRGGLDIYGRHTKDLIISKSIRSSYGTQSMDYNVGKMNNNGMEGFVNIGVLKNRDWEWRMGFNFSRNINEIIYANNEEFGTSEIIDRMLAGNMAVEGAPIGSIYAYRFAQLNQDNGYPMFYTKDGRMSVRGTKEDMELVRVGSIFPKLTGGFDTQLNYKSISLSLNFAYSVGSVSRLPNYYNGRSVDPTSNVSAEWLESWHQTGDNTIYPSVFDSMRLNDYIATDEGAQYNTYDLARNGTVVLPTNMYNYSDIRVADADFLKLKLISLSYRLPAKITKTLMVQNMMLRLQVTNLFTIAEKKWRGLDPETRGAGIPQTRTYSLTANISL